MGRKRKCPKQSLDKFVESLDRKDNNMPYSEYLQVIREKILQCSKNDFEKVQNNYILEKLCEVCGDYHDDDKLLLCDYCDDTYHTFCLNPPLEIVPSEEEDWFCPVCVEEKFKIEREKKMAEKRQKFQVQNVLEQYRFGHKKQIASKVKICGKCQDMILFIQSEGVVEESETCVKCQKLFHKGCFNKRQEAIICTQCQIQVQRQIPQTQILLDEYFQELSFQQDQIKKKRAYKKKQKDTILEEPQGGDISNQETITLEKQKVMTTQDTKEKLCQDNICENLKNDVITKASVIELTKVDQQMQEKQVEVILIADNEQERESILQEIYKIESLYTHQKNEKQKIIQNMKPQANQNYQIIDLEEEEDFSLKDQIEIYMKPYLPKPSNKNDLIIDLEEEEDERNKVHQVEIQKMESLLLRQPNENNQIIDLEIEEVDSQQKSERKDLSIENEIKEKTCSFSDSRLSPPSLIKKMKTEKEQNISCQFSQNIRSIQSTEDSESTNSGGSNIDNKLVKNEYQFLLPEPSPNEEVNIKCRQSLIFALKAKNIQFCDDLIYSSACRKENNNFSLEQGLQEINQQNSLIFQKFKKMTRQGVYAPVIVVEDKIQGFIVKAQEIIKPHTLITEYVGEVDFARNHIFNQNDSIMELLRTPRSVTSLVIVPQKRGNLARFLSGINNSSRKSKAKQNVHSLRFSVEGESRVLLFSKKTIKKGEILYYDYNAGATDDYPTDDFI